MSDDTFASDAEREQAVSRLRDASTEGRLTLEELASRTDAAYTARTRGELVRATDGLPQATAATPRTRGRHRIAAGLFAPATVDLRRARVDAGETTVTVVGLFAPAHVVVPAHVDVELDVVGLFAPVRETGAEGAPPPGAPRVRVRGLALFAPVVVRHQSG